MQFLEISDFEKIETALIITLPIHFKQFHLERRELLECLDAAIYEKSHLYKHIYMDSDEIIKYNTQLSVPKNKICIGEGAEGRYLLNILPDSTDEKVYLQPYNYPERDSDKVYDYKSGDYIWDSKYCRGSDNLTEHALFCCASWEKARELETMPEYESIIANRAKIIYGIDGLANKDKIAFCHKYQHCAESIALEKIWYRKEVPFFGMDLSKNHITDLSPLSELTNLEDLNISGTKVVDLSPIKHLKKLKKLSMSNCAISDLSPIQNLVNLKVIAFSSTQVTDLSPLSNLKKLEWIFATATPVSNLSPLKSLSKLDNLCFNSTQVTDLSPLKESYSLKCLDISETPVLDLSPLAGLKNIVVLKINATLITDLSPLNGHMELLFLDISNTGIQTLDDLNFEKLRDFKGNQSKITNLSFLKNCRKLHGLYVFGTGIFDLTPLQDINSLRYLDISDTKVADLTPLKGLKNLSMLHARATQIKEYPLEHLKNLTNIDVTYLI